MWEAAAAAVGAFIFGWIIRGRFADQQLQSASFRYAEKARKLIEAETRYLELHQRELANILLNIDAEAMERAYHEARRQQDEAINGGPERVAAELQVLSRKFPFYRDFDLIGTQHFVPYRDGIDWTPHEDIIKRYLEISQWLGLNAYQEHGDKLPRLFNDDDYKVLNRVMREDRDRKLKARIEAAMEDYRLFQSAINEHGKEGVAYSRLDMESARFSIRKGRREYSPEIEYWLSFKEPEEYAIYSFFVADDGQSHYSLYRSDKTFQKHETLSTR